MTDQGTTAAGQPEDQEAREEFRSCEQVASYLYDQMPYRESPPDKISVERATPEVYAVRIFERGEMVEAFFLKLKEDSPI